MPCVFVSSWPCVSNLIVLSLFASLASSGQVTGSARTALAIVEDTRTRRPIVDVGADDVVVQEGKESREVLSVRVADYPVVLMIDTGGQSEDLPLVQTAAKYFVERLGSERPIAVGTFGGPPKILAGLDADRGDTMTKLDELTATTSGDRSVAQAARAAVQTLAPGGSLFSAIVVLSSSSKDDRAANGVPDEDDAVASVVASGAMLYVVANRSPSAETTVPASRGAAGLRALAEQSRGQFITIYTAASYQAALDQIATRMTSELLIEYLVPNRSRATDVRVGVRLPGARVRGLGVAPR